ncbi:hypothetical protein MMC13_000417 [Lambiella insularis]|nr:hypothetical protein [Lambiella insularis]
MRAFSPFRSHASQSQSNAHPLLPLHTSHLSPSTSPSRPAASILLPPPPSLAFIPASASSTSADSDTLRALARQTAHLQKTLQQLLDAQSAGLLAGLGAAPHDAPPPVPRVEIPRPQGARRYHDAESASSEDGSRTPTTRGSSLSRVGSTDGYARFPPGESGQATLRSRDVPATRRRKQQASLRAARTGILRVLHELADVKAQEGEVLAGQLRRHEEVLGEMDSAETKRVGIEREIASIEQDEREGRGVVEALGVEEREVEREIAEVEERLAELRARLRRVRAQREERGNRLEARLSSWRAALEDAERDVREKWLSGKGEGVSSSQRKGVWALPRERRTLELVKENLQEEKAGVEEKLGGVEVEREACLTGAQVWEGVIATVNGVENKLKVELGNLGSGQGTRDGKVEGNGDDAGDAGGSGIEAVLQHMTTAMASLSSQLDLAEAHGWKLLVCSIGAELEALREGRDMLLSALEQSGFLPREGGSELLGDMAGGETGSAVLQKGESSDLSRIQGSTLLSSASQSFHTSKDGREGKGMGIEDEGKIGAFQEDVPDVHGNGIDRSEDEDDGPGPELLIEQ